MKARAISNARAANVLANVRQRVFGVALAIAPLMFAGPTVGAELDGNYTDSATIDAVVRAIPMADKSMGYKSLAERLPNLGLTVRLVNVGKFTKSDVQGEPQRLRPGDVDYRFVTNEPASVVREICPISSTFNFIKRGQKWIPQDRTSQFLVSGLTKCAAPR